MRECGSAASFRRTSPYMREICIFYARACETLNWQHTPLCICERCIAVTCVAGARLTSGFVHMIIIMEGWIFLVPMLKGTSLKKKTNFWLRFLRTYYDKRVGNI